MDSLKKQVGGKHYQDFVIPPVQFIQQNGLGFIEGCIIQVSLKVPGTVFSPQQLAAAKMPS